MRKAILGIAAATAVGAALVTPQTAAAATPTDLQDCAPFSICGWSGFNFTGSITTFPNSSGCKNTSFPLRSIANTHPGIGIPIAAGVYSGPNCTGEIVASVGRGQTDPFVNPPGLSVFIAV